MRKWEDLPLKIRLTAFYVVLFSFLLLVLATASYLGMRHFLISGMVENLETRAKTALSQWPTSPNAPPIPPAPPPGPPEAAGVSRDPEGLATALASGDSTVVLMDDRGSVIAAAGRDAATVSPEKTCLSRARASGREATCVASFGGRRYLVLEIPLGHIPGGNGPGVVQISAPLQPVDRILALQQMLLGVGIGVLLLLGTAVGLWITSSALKPLGDMVDTCNRIAEGDFGQRVNLPQRNDEIGKLATAFDHMADRIEEMFEAQKRFVASAAHELRTPLSAIHGSLEVLLRGALDDPPTAHRLTLSMYREVTRLFRLCDQLLDLSRAQESEPIHKQSLDISRFFEEFMAQAKFLARERNLTLTAGPPMVLHADPDALKRVLFNLVDNAVQHTSDGGNIVVGWESAGNGVQIFVEDDGEGILPEDLPHLFEPFYRGDRSRSRWRGGTGLGLAISKALVEAHGGKITVSSTPGRGTKFLVWIPG